MRNVILCSFIVFLLVNCRSIGNTQEVSGSEPTRSFGCSKFKGSEWFRCLEKLHERWEKIESSSAEITVLSESREGEYIRKKKRICWTEVFCHTYDQVVYSPSFLQRVKRLVEIAVPSFTIGILIGLFL
ncbi:hypothetical protein EHQ76_07480 [Leptospira barantonii]|uniref:Uncharacterized protein n=1 Tax=Leptospira barantonii TaxID=2023184 RepID=A0A5F2BH17_9LEPT|nr:hypothetical protein [Leptospira barantonii]TGM04875.1 hypothetical protein EHQ76_07480 [Leptospira barantonii]